MSLSAWETERLGEELGKVLSGGQILALCGELGAGKTTFVRGLAKGLGIPPETVSSPSFVLIQEYTGRLTLYHVDFYRLESLLDIELIGLRDLWREDTIVAIEWADKIPQAIPEDALWFQFFFLDQHRRKIKFKGGQNEVKLVHFVFEKVRRQGEGENGAHSSKVWGDFSS